MAPSGESAYDAAGPVVEVEFSVRDTTYPFVSATTNGSRVVELAEIVPRSSGRYAEFFNVTGGDPAAVLDLAETYESLDVTLLREYEDGGFFEFVASGNCPAYSLAKRGGLPREAVAADGEGRVVAEIPPQYDPSAVIDGFREANPEAELVSKREKERLSPMFTKGVLDEVLHDRLTDRQYEILRTAYDAGYYDWPREVSGQDVAAELGISSATFSEHIHAAERKVFALLFEQSAGE